MGERAEGSRFLPTVPWSTSTLSPLVLLPSPSPNTRSKIHNNPQSPPWPATSTITKIVGGLVPLPSHQNILMSSVVTCKDTSEENAFNLH